MLLAIALISTAFGLLLRRHKRVRWENELAKAKIEINKAELRYLENGELPFDNGRSFIDPHHDYSYDLDFFGEHSIYQHLNRTGTETGKRVLADSLLHILPKAHILQNQEAIGELKDEIEWRQDLLALAQLKPDSPESVEDLLNWSQRKPANIPSVLNLFAWVVQ